MEEEIPEPELTNIVGHVLAICEKMLPMIRKSCKEMVPSVDANLISSCLNFLKAFLGVDGMDLRKQNNQNVSKAISTYIAFSLTWSLGGNLHESSRKEFNRALRAELKSRFSDLPDGDVYEQGVDRQIHQL
jgi:hypothetical protein